MRPALGWIFGLVLISAGVAAWVRSETRASHRGATLFTPDRGAAIVIPRAATEAERRAAALLRSTLAKASGRPEQEFPIEAEGRRESGRAIFVGATQRGARFLHRAPAPPFDTAVSCEVSAGDVILRSERRDSIEAAAGWFLEHTLGVHWFMPGPLGEVIPRRGELVLPAGATVVRPGFASRDLGTGGGPDERAWYARNRLEARFHHSHNLDNIFRPEHLRANPELAPLRYGRRFMPVAGDYNWQPDLTNPVAIAHAADAANRAFASNPDLLSFSLSENDSARFDASSRTLHAVSPPRFFRTRPDYSDLVFGFANGVAERVARVHPGRYLPTYAYYWAENTPRFRVAASVVPFLTADRGQWFDPAFAAEDRALIERWTKSGADVVGAYDYYYGAPFLVPRPLLATVRESIPFLHRAGVQAFYAESSPNWALDGPKAWLTTQLLWNPTQSPETLLETYYREFWGEVAAPMREFFARCDRAWLEQPRPGYWIKYYQDEHQALLFPPAVRAELDAALSQAGELARPPEIRARLEFVREGWEGAKRFLEYCDARDRLSRSAAREDASGALAAEWLAHAKSRAAFTAAYARIQEATPLALAPQKIDIYLRNDPSGRATRALIRSELGHQFLQANAELRPGAATAHELARLFAEGSQTLVDPRWEKLRPKAIGGSPDFEWLELGGHWQASGEPAERRSIMWIAAEHGEQAAHDRRQASGGEDRDGIAGNGSPGERSSLNSPRSTGNAATTLDLQLSTGANAQPSAGRPKRVRLTGCRQEFLVQWQPTKPGALYAAEIDVRAKVSPGNQTFLIVNFLDEKQQRVGGGQVDRLPAESAEQSVRLCVISRAPANARYVGLGIRVIHQVNDDFAEFSGASLKRLDETAAR